MTLGLEPIGPDSRQHAFEHRSSTPHTPTDRAAARPRHALLVAAIALGLSACTAHAAARPAPVRSSPAVTEMPSGAPRTVPSAFARDVTAAPLISPAHAGGLTSSPWTLIAVSRDGLDLTVRADQGGGCDEPGGIELRQTTTLVELASLYKHDSPPPGTACAAYLAAPLWSVRLERPLGERALVHAPATGATP